MENTSGLPFPKAKKVTPAVDSFKPKYWAIVERFGQKKSDAEIPMKEKRKQRMTKRAETTKGFAAGEAESYQVP